MNPSTKRHLEYCVIGCVVFAAIGLRVGIWVVDTLWHAKPGGAK
jgi:hypothetical protein